MWSGDILASVLGGLTAAAVIVVFEMEFTGTGPNTSSKTFKMS